MKRSLTNDTKYETLHADVGKSERKFQKMTIHEEHATQTCFGVIQSVDTKNYWFCTEEQSGRQADRNTFVDTFELAEGDQVRVVQVAQPNVMVRLP